MVLLPIPDPNKPEQHEAWCPLGYVALSCKNNISLMHVLMCEVFSLHLLMYQHGASPFICHLSSVSDDRLRLIVSSTSIKKKQMKPILMKYTGLMDYDNFFFHY